MSQTGLADACLGGACCLTSDSGGEPTKSPPPLRSSRSVQLTCHVLFLGFWFFLEKIAWLLRHSSPPLDAGRLHVEFPVQMSLTVIFIPSVSSPLVLAIHPRWVGCVASLFLISIPPFLPHIAWRRGLHSVHHPSFFHDWSW